MIKLPFAIGRMYVRNEMEYKDVFIMKGEEKITWKYS